MKSFYRVLIAAVIAVATAFTASAQFKIGPRVGMNVNSLHFDSSTFEKGNQTGFTGGLQCEFTVPVIGVGFDLSVMYVHQVNGVNNTEKNPTIGEIDNDNFKSKDFIEIPLNLKYKLSLPLIGKIVKPYFTTGPSVAFLTSRKAISEAYKNKKVDWAWNLGFGVEVLSHLQVGASYGIGLNNTIEKLDIADTADINCKTRAWTITAAYLF